MPVKTATHAPARGATQADGERAGRVLYCNPRSCARSDYEMRIVIIEAGIATHAPARGATWALKEGVCCVKIATHAPARGATGA